MTALHPIPPDLAATRYYRVIYGIFETAVQVEVVAVQHRADGYR
jgi:hypothetical protein